MKLIKDTLSQTPFPPRPQIEPRNTQTTASLPSA